jgi:hypothetical protein
MMLVLVFRYYAPQDDKGGIEISKHPREFSESRDHPSNPLSDSPEVRSSEKPFSGSTKKSFLSSNK